jgi:hypothetical protein
METYEEFTMTVDFDKPTSGYMDNIDRDKEQEGVEVAMKEIQDQLKGDPEIEDSELSEIAQKAFDDIVGEAYSGGYTISVCHFKHVVFGEGAFLHDADSLTDRMYVAWWSRIFGAMDKDTLEKVYKEHGRINYNLRDFLRSYLKVAPCDLYV